MNHNLSYAPPLSDLLHAHRGSGTVRILFLHATSDRLLPEYKVHKVLAESAESHGVQSFFLWQRGAHPTGDNMMSVYRPEQIRYLDFGRDSSVYPSVNRLNRSMQMLRRLPGLLLAVVAHVRAERPDLLYTAQQKWDVRIAQLISRLTHVPHVIHLHYMVVSYLGRDIVYTIRRASRIVAVSEFIRQNAISQGVDPMAVSTVPNAISPDEFLYTGDRSALRREFGWEPDAPVLITAGRLDPMKGHLQVIDAFASVNQQIPRARLLICGRELFPSVYPELLRQRVAELGLQNVVAFAGYRHDLPQLMRAADAFVLLSETEPFGLVFLEAMAANLPVVAFYSGAVPEVVVDGVTGLLSYPNQHEATVCNLVRLLSDRSFATEMGTAGRTRAANIFSAERIAPAWVSLMHRFAGRTA